MSLPDLGGGQRRSRRPGSIFTGIFLLSLLFSSPPPSSTPEQAISGESDSFVWDRRTAPLVLRSDDLELNCFLCSCVADFAGLRSEVKELLMNDSNIRSDPFSSLFLRFDSVTGGCKLSCCFSRQGRYTLITPIVLNINSKFIVDFGALHGLNSVMVKAYLPSGDYFRRAVSGSYGPTLSRRCYRVLAACFTGVFGHGYHTGTIPHRYFDHDPIFFKSDLIVAREYSMTEVLFSAQNRVHYCDDAEILYGNTTTDYHRSELVVGVSCASAKKFLFCPWCRRAALQKERVQTLIPKTDLWALVTCISDLMDFGPQDPNILEKKNANLGFRDFCSWAKCFKFFKRSLSFGLLGLVILLNLYSYSLVVSNFGSSNHLM